MDAKVGGLHSKCMCNILYSFNILRAEIGLGKHYAINAAEVGLFSTNMSTKNI